ncbi:hypothetical protein HETIRDRAFT_120777 [Heterobasidion irregulare TC 32-1]|uniref:Uncharacterized protein n=1 Tax=Heterobasidion irregulare (strain TC 32-1) TaxID=747525 RepID=W4K9I9_HETIT|nr:uncharacterized protein HETIRDRAFT_120777 [Heterobasidion irregulare TC 32-1]ETW82502.1 hypothetical protein HETIRDRAFT_120777 [Heterobasidion irregulare TC 32-1]
MQGIVRRKVLHVLIWIMREQERYNGQFLLVGMTMGYRKVLYLAWDVFQNMFSYEEESWKELSVNILRKLVGVDKESSWSPIIVLVPGCYVGIGLEVPGRTGTGPEEPAVLGFGAIPIGGGTLVGDLLGPLAFPSSVPSSCGASREFLPGNSWQVLSLFLNLA